MSNTRRVLMLFLTETAVALDEGKPLAEAIVMGAARIVDMEPAMHRGNLGAAEAEAMSRRIKSALDIIKAAPELPHLEWPHHVV